MDKRIADYTKKEKDLLLHGKAQKISVKFGGKNVNLTCSRLPRSPGAT
jgi:hypothetical protein